MAGYVNSYHNQNPYINITSIIQMDILYAGFCFNVLFGLPTHSYILWLIATGRGIASEFLHVNKTFCEIIICMFSLITLLVLWFPELMTLATFSLGLLNTGRPLFQCVMCVECYLAVVHPVTFLKFKPLRYKMVSSVAIWLTSLGSCVFNMFTSVAHAKVYMCWLLLHFLFFLSVNLFCCLAVLWTLKKPGPGERGRQREEQNNTKRRAFSLILVIVVSMVIMFAPAVITGIIYFLSSKYVSTLRSICFLGFILAGFVEPVMYLQKSGKLPFLCWS